MTTARLTSGFVSKLERCDRWMPNWAPTPITPWLFPHPPNWTDALDVQNRRSGPATAAGGLLPSSLLCIPLLSKRKLQNGKCARTSACTLIFQRSDANTAFTLEPWDGITCAELVTPRILKITMSCLLTSHSPSSSTHLYIHSQPPLGCRQSLSILLLSTPQPFSHQVSCSLSNTISSQYRPLKSIFTNDTPCLNKSPRDLIIFFGHIVLGILLANMDPITNNDSSSSISPIRPVLNFDVLWETLEYIIVELFTAKDPMPWAQAAGGLMRINQELSDRALLPLRKLSRAMYWAREALWLDYEAGDEATSTKRTYLQDREWAISKVLDIIGAHEDWAFLHAADRSLTGFTFHVEKYIIDPATNEASEPCT